MSETAEQVAKELSITDFDAGNDRDKMFLGIITKLRGKNRELSNSLDSTTTKYNSLNDEVTTFRRTAKETEIITGVLGDKKQIGDADKFNRWRAKLANGDSWEDDLKQLVEDFAVEKTIEPAKKDEKKPEQKKSDEKPGEKKSDEKPGEKKDEKPGDEKPDDKKDEKKPAYQSRHSRGGTEEIAGTAIKAPRTMSERLRLMQENPEAYEEWKAQKGR